MAGGHPGSSSWRGDGPGCCSCHQGCIGLGVTEEEPRTLGTGLRIGTAAMVLPLRTQLPWYSHLLWPPIALICAEGLTDLLNLGQPLLVSWIWQGLGLAVLILVITLQVTPTATEFPRNALICSGLGLILGAPFLRNPSGRWRQRGLLLLVVGWCLALADPVAQQAVAVGAQ